MGRQLTGPKARAKAIRLHNRIVRDMRGPRCEAFGWVDPLTGHSLECDTMPVQCAHIVRTSRGGRIPSAIENGVVLCRSHHQFMDTHEPDFLRFLDHLIGQDLVDNLYRRLGTDPKPTAQWWRDEVTLLVAICKKRGLKTS